MAGNSEKVNAAAVCEQQTNKELEEVSGMMQLHAAVLVDRTLCHLVKNHRRPTEDNRKH